MHRTQFLKKTGNRNMIEAQDRFELWLQGLTLNTRRSYGYWLPRLMRMMKNELLPTALLTLLNTEPGK
jgi:hypothetical protein